MAASLPKASEAVVWDLETDGLLESVTRIHCCVALRNGEVLRGNSNDPKALKALLEAVMGAEVIVGHNIIAYDLAVLKKLHGMAPSARVVDTLVLSRLAYPNLFEFDCIRRAPGMGKQLYGRHSLEAWGYRLGVLKGDYGKQDKAWEQWSQEMEDYCVNDVQLTAKLLDHFVAMGLADSAIDTEMRLQDIICAQERWGFQFDLAAAQTLNATLQERRTVLLRELHEAFPPKPAVCEGPYQNQAKRAAKILEGFGQPEDGWRKPEMYAQLVEEGIRFKWSAEEAFNPNSEKQIAERMIQLGWVPTDFTEHGQPKLDEDVLVSLGAQFPQARPLAEFSLVEKRLGQLSTGSGAWMKLVGDDLRMHGRCNTMGTITYRFTHSTPNMAQVPRVGSPYGKECRSLFCVPSGWRLVGCDVSGLELRILAHYMARWDSGEYAKIVCDGDIHTRNMQVAGLSERSRAKTFIYALIYGAGDAKLGQIVHPDETSEDKLRKAGKALRKRFLSKTPALAALESAVRVKAGRDKKLVGIDGRILRIRSAHSALNTLIQSAGSIAVKVATVRFRTNMEAAGHKMERDWCLVAHVHDEWQTECKEHIADDAARYAVQSIVESGQQLQLRCPLTGESKAGRNWADTH